MGVETALTRIAGANRFSGSARLSRSSPVLIVAFLACAQRYAVRDATTYATEIAALRAL